MRLHGKGRAIQSMMIQALARDINFRSGRPHLFSLAKQPSLKLKNLPRPKRYIAEADLVFILEHNR